MLRRSTWSFGGAISRKTAAIAAASSKATSSPHSYAKPVGKSRPPSAHAKRGKGARSSSQPSSIKELKKVSSTTTATSHSTADGEAPTYLSSHTARPAYMSEEREKEVLSLAERMQIRDLSGAVPVASFAYEILKCHPSVRDMGIRERMDFLCRRWDKLGEKKRLEYINDPLRGLL